MTNEEWLNSLDTKDKVNVIINGICSLCVNNEECILPTEHECKEGIMKYLQQTHVEPMPKLAIGDILKLKFIYKNGAYRLDEATYLGCNAIYIHYMGIGSLESHINDISEIYRVANDGRRMDIIWKKY